MHQVIRNEDSLKGNHYIYSNDSDSIIGSLQFIDKNIFIIIKNDERKPYLKSPYSIIDIKKFREYLLSKLHFHGQFDVKRVMHDVIALSPLWCNDIIPIFRDISTKEHYFDTLLDSYFKINKNKANNYEYLIDDKNKICFSTFIKVISQFFKREIKIATPKEKQKNKRKCEMAKEVYKTLNFCFLYITQGVPSWTYYYPYDKSDNYVNDISDLIRYMDQEENNFVEFTKNDDEIPTHLFKAFVTQPINYLDDIPWPIYSIKLMPELIGMFISNDKDMIPMFDYIKLRDSFNNELNKIPEEQRKKYCQIDDAFHVYELEK